MRDNEAPDPQPASVPRPIPQCDEAGCPPGSPPPSFI